MEKKKIAILGGGNGSHMMAADMKVKGHEVRMYEMPEFRENVTQLFNTQTIEVSGIMKEKIKVDMVTDDIRKAVDGADYILVVTPAFAHKDYANLLKGNVTKDQIIVVFPGAFAALIFKNIIGDDNCPIIADANNLPYDARLTSPCKVTLFGRNKINIAFLPAEKGP